MEYHAIETAIELVKDMEKKHKIRNAVATEYLH